MKPSGCTFFIIREKNLKANLVLIAVLAFILKFSSNVQRAPGGWGAPSTDQARLIFTWLVFATSLLSESPSLATKC